MMPPGHCNHRRSASGREICTIEGPDRVDLRLLAVRFEKVHLPPGAGASSRHEWRTIVSSGSQLEIWQKQMAAPYKTPGLYVEEVGGFPSPAEFIVLAFPQQMQTS